MKKNILFITIMLISILLHAQKQYIPKPLTSHEPVPYTNIDLGYTKGVKRVTVIDSASGVIAAYGFNLDGLQIYYTEKNGRYSDSMVNIYNNGKLVKNEAYEDGVRSNYRTYDYKNGNLILFREFSGRKLFTKTAYTYKKGKLIKASTKMRTIKFCEKYEYIDEKHSLRKRKIATRTFEITDEVNTKKFKSVQVYDPDDLNFHYEKQTYQYNDDGFLIEFIYYYLNNEYLKCTYTYDNLGLRNIKEFRYGILNTEIFLDTHDFPVKVNFYYSNSLNEYENKYNDKGDLIRVDLINDGKLTKKTIYEIEYW